MPKEKSTMQSSSQRFNPLTGDEEIECPYNNTHVIRKNKMAKHLFKCRKNYPNSTLKECPFNRTHLFEPDVMAAHTAECPDRETFDLYKYNIVNSTNDMPKVEKPAPKNNDDDELWETCDGPSYDPQKYVEKANLIKHIVGGTKTERRKLREKERERLMKLEEENSD